MNLSRNNPIKRPNIALPELYQDGMLFPYFEGIESSLPGMIDKQTGEEYTTGFPITYHTNYTVSKETAYLFFTRVSQYRQQLMHYHEKDAQMRMISLIAYILTQELKIIVRHDRWLYFFEGKIYRQCSSSLEIIPKLRELCENAAYAWSGFRCDSTTPHQVLAHIEQTAPEYDYPLDISNYIVFNNCVLNLAAGLPENFTTGRFITNMINVDWLPEAKDCPVFDSMIATYTQNDPVLTERLLQALGLCLTNDTVKRFICFLGITNSGKTFLVSLLLSMLNDESIAMMQPNDFSQRFASGMIYGKSVCACMDMDAAPLNTRAAAFIKQVSGGDTIGAEFKHQNGLVMFRSRAHMILCSNFNIVPEIEDIAFESRKLVIPFRYRLTDDAVPFEQLMQRLECEKPAIVQKLIAAYLRLKAEIYSFSGTGSWYDTYKPPIFAPPGAISSLRQYVSAFYENTADPADYVFAEDLYNAYAQYQAAHFEELYCFSSSDSFYKTFKEAFSAVQTDRKRRHPNANPQSCYIGLRRKNSNSIL